jgi:hypothetical protein
MDEDLILQLGNACIPLFNDADLQLLPLVLSVVALAVKMVLVMFLNIS